MVILGTERADEMKKGVFDSRGQTPVTTASEELK
jgi:hypothetical protein